jgi:hypothetical protein
VERHIGTTSTGDRSCTQDGVDARTDAPQIAAFIQPTIDAFENQDPCRADGVCNESCNTNGRLVDPDCAENHCGQDGICVISCVSPADPDCTGSSQNPMDGGTELGFSGRSEQGAAIPYNSTRGILSAIVVDSDVPIATVAVALDITHTYRGDLEVSLSGPDGTLLPVVRRDNPGDSTHDLKGTFSVDGFSGSARGTWTLLVRDLAAQDVGRLNSWRLGINQSP